MKLEKMKDKLVEFTCAHMDDLECVDTVEMGAVVDMIKDLEEAIYYETITDAMKHKVVEPEEVAK